MRKKIYPLFLWGIIALFSSMAYAEEKTLPKPIFKLTKGEGTEVCEAYLQRLSATEFVDNDPVKGRITEPLLKGFVDLKPVPLTADEIQHIFYKIVSFSRFRNQDLLQQDILINTKNETEAWRIQQVKKLSEFIKNAMLYESFIRYKKKIDMDNDGIESNIVIKNNYGSYIVDKRLQRVDDANMMAIFSDKELLEWPTITQFPPIAISTSIFNYKGKYYFDGFLDLLFYNSNHKIDNSVPLRIGVFINQHKNTQKICEYQVINHSTQEIRQYYQYLQSYSYS